MVTKKKHFIAVFLIAIFCSFSGLFAQESNVNENNTGEEIEGEEKNQEAKKLIISVEDAVNSALENHVDIKRSELSLSQSESEYKHLWNNFLPSISVSGNGEKQQGIGNSTTDTLSVYAGVSASLSLDFGLADRIKGLKASYEAGLLSYEDTVRSTEFAVRADFYNLILLYETYKSSESNLDSYLRQYNQTRAKYNSGAVPELDLLTAQVNYETAKPEVETAKSNYYDALVRFLDTVGIEVVPGTEVELSGSLDIASKVKLPDDIDAEESAENSIEVRLLKNSIESAQYSKRAQMFSSWLPSVSVSGSYEPKVYSLNNNTGVSSDNPYWSVSLGVSLPIDNWIPGSSANDAIKKLDNSVEDYKIQLEDTRKTVRTEIVEKIRNINNLQATIETRRLNVDLARRSYEMTSTAYNRGTKNLLTLQDSLDTLHTAELSLMEEQYELLTNVLELENVLGLDASEFFEE